MKNPNVRFSTAVLLTLSAFLFMGVVCVVVTEHLRTANFPKDAFVSTMPESYYSNGSNHDYVPQVKFFLLNPKRPAQSSEEINLFLINAHLVGQQIEWVYPTEWICPVANLVTIFPAIIVAPPNSTCAVTVCYWIKSPGRVPDPELPQKDESDLDVVTQTGILPDPESVQKPRAEVSSKVSSASPPRNPFLRSKRP
jgi:hypothetical protein